MVDGPGLEGRLPPLLLSRRARRLVALAYLLVAVAIVADLVTGPGSTFSPLLAAVPVLVSTGTRRAAVPLVAGLLAAVVVAGLAVANQEVPAVVHATALATVLAVTCTSTATVVLVTARERELAQVRTVAAAAQQALLRPIPERIGSLRLAVRYLAATAEARIGGDIYAVVATPFGTRLFLGDVRGKGLTAVETAADVLGVFRDIARSEPDLSAVARHLDASLARRPPSEEFVTAVLVTIPDVLDSGSPAVVVNCGHPPPLLCRARSVTEIRPSACSPPLGLLGLVGGGYPCDTLHLGPGDLLLLYTDGVSEARDRDGTFYPLTRRLARMQEQDPDALLDRLLADVRNYVDSAMNDDAALLAARRDN